jgi:hypothetical protein
MEGDPVDTAHVTFDDVLYLDFRAAKDLVGARSRFLHTPFFEAGKVPDAHRLIERCTSNQRVFRMERSTHDVVTVTSQDSDNTSSLPIPKSHSLIITGGNNPGQLLMELDRAHIVEMTRQREHALLRLVAPHFDLVIVTTTDK